MGCKGSWVRIPLARETQKTQSQDWVFCVSERAWIRDHDPVGVVGIEARCASMPPRRRDTSRRVPLRQQGRGGWPQRGNPACPTRPTRPKVALLFCCRASVDLKPRPRRGCGHRSAVRFHAPSLPRHLSAGTLATARARGVAPTGESRLPDSSYPDRRSLSLSSYREAPHSAPLLAPWQERRKAPRASR